MHNPIVWLTVSNVLYLVSYSVRDILWLRTLTVVAAGLLIPYYAMQSTPLTAAIWWSCLFIAINFYWIVRLSIERRPVHLTPDEDRLRTLSFPSLTAREARDLFATGRWDSLAPGASVVVRDRETVRFSVILRGVADVIYRGTKIAEFGEGQFVGEIDRCADSGLEIDVLVRENLRSMCWQRDSLDAYVATRPDVELALERSSGLEVQRLLDSTLAKLK